MKNLNNAGFKVVMIIYIFIIAPPYIFSVLPEYSTPISVLNKVAFLISFAIVAYYFSKRRPSRIIILSIAFTLWIAFCDLLNNNSGIPAVINEMIKIIGLSCVIELTYNSPKFDIAFNKWADYFFIISVVNLASQLVKSDGIIYLREKSWQPYFVIGSANRFVFFYIIAFVINCIYVFHINQKNIGRLVLLSAIIVASFIIAGNSTTGFIVSLILISPLLLQNKFIKAFLLKHFRGLVLTGILFMAYIVLGGWNSSLVQNLVNSIGESSSFTERGEIWTNAIKLILENGLIFGSGSQNTQFSLYNGLMRSTHNTFLQVTIYGGIIALILFVIIIVVTFKNINYCKYKKTDIMQYIVVAMISIVISFSFEQYPFYLGFFIIATYCNCEYLLLNEGDKYKNEDSL